MKNQWKVSVLFVLFCQAISASGDEHIFPASMVVITSDARPLLHEDTVRNAFALRGKHSDFQVHNLDAVKTLEADLSRDLPANEHLATHVVKHRLSKIGKHKLSQRVGAAYAALTTAMRFGITHYPAIVFDEHYVVIGVSDVSIALRVYQAYKKGGGQ